MPMLRPSVDPSQSNGESASAVRRAAQKRAHPSVGTFEIPIVNAQRRIVGWTRMTPNFHAGTLRHPEAERTLGEPVLGAYVLIVDPVIAQRAGAPAGWPKEWRCLGLCSAQALARSGDGGDLPAVA